MKQINIKLLIENLVFYIFFLIIIIALFLCSMLCKDACAKCYIHVVEEKETLASISKKYTGETQHWQGIQKQNALKDHKICVGQNLYVYVPEEDDWAIACRNIIETRLHQIRVIRPKEFIDDIIYGISVASDRTLHLSPRKKVEMCRVTLTTALHESYCMFSIGGAGELGIYQFKVSTVQLTGEWYGMHHVANATDELITYWMLDTAHATEIFVLHFHELHKRYGNLWLSWKRYNNGSDASAYATRAMEKYYKIKQINPINCRKATND